jgi:hypothetical protein
MSYDDERQYEAGFAATCPAELRHWIFVSDFTADAARAHRELKMQAFRDSVAYYGKALAWCGLAYYPGWGPQSDPRVDRGSVTCLRCLYAISGTTLTSV